MERGSGQEIGIGYLYRQQIFIMNTFFRTAAACLLIFTGLSVRAQQRAQEPAMDIDSIIGWPPAPRLISDQFSFTEGASVDRKGNVFFTDQPNNKIWEYTTDGKLILFLDSAGRSNGM